MEKPEFSYTLIEQDLDLDNASIDQQAIAYDYWYDFAEIAIERMKNGTNTR